MPDQQVRAMDRILTNIRFSGFSIRQVLGTVLRHQHLCVLGKVLLGYVWNVTILCVPALIMHEYSAV